MKLAEGVAGRLTLMDPTGPRPGSKASRDFPPTTGVQPQGRRALPRRRRRRRRKRATSRP
jgi:hypothetical protein